MWAPEGAEILDGRDALAQKLVEVAGNGRSQLALITQRLERALYAPPALSEALTRFILRNERCRLRVLVADARSAAAGGNPFLEWAHRFPSRVELREISPERNPRPRCERLVADARQVLQRDHADMLQAAYLASAPRLARDLMREFDELWEEAQPSAELRQLRL